MNAEHDPSIVGNLSLGNYPSNLARLPSSIESLGLAGSDPIIVDSSWFDLTMLGYLAILLRSCKKPEVSLTLRFENDQKYPFLWRSGFFSASGIGHRGSPFKVEPDIWMRRPDNIGSRVNFTPLIVFEVNSDHTVSPQVHGYSEFAKHAANSLLLELEKTHVYSVVEHSELMESREYLHVVLWELVQNIIDHAKATNAIIAAQVFYKGDGNGDRALSGLRAQHYMEEEHCELPLRKNWLKGNREKSYLMLTCIDNGIGIPGSIRGKKDMGEQYDDKHLLDSSFQRESSDHDTFEHRYKIHGLHLIAQLVSSYQGYLFAQSGTAHIEATAQPASSTTIREEMSLPGTAFQVLLPLTAGDPRPYIVPHGVPHRTPVRPNVIFATEELRKHTFRLPPSRDDQQAAVDSLVRTASRTSGVLFLDFIGMPRERHFTSLLLLCVRRKKTDYPTIVLNASEELFTSIRGLRSPTSGIPSDGEMLETDRALATDLTRGEDRALLPLVMAVTRLRDTRQSRSDGTLSNPGIAIQWLGIADDGPHDLEACAVMLLDELFCADDAVGEFNLENLAVRAGKPEGTAKTLLRNIQRANPNLLSYIPTACEWRLAFNASSLYFDSVQSLTQRLDDAVNTLAKLNVPVGTIFYLNWRTNDQAYLRDYYQLWRVVRDPELARVAATLLLRAAHDDRIIGAQVAQLSALISVTASAGLLAREIARILRIPHWEAASVYDLKRAEWPRDFAGDQVLIVDDLIDSGTASRMVIEELARRKAKCAGVLSLLASAEGRETREMLATPIVSLFKVELGRPTQAEIDAADANGTIWDVDPHTLEPMPRKRFSDEVRRNSRTTKNDLTQLARCGGLRSGHFVYGGHHYYEFFDIVRYMDAREGFDDLWDWFQESVRQWHSSTVAPIGGRKASVAIIYPYYSPIAAFLHCIHALLPVAFGFTCSIHVARPYQRSKQRVGYRVDSLGAKDRFAVFVDDGIASGGTLSEVVDEFVSIHNAAETKALHSAIPRAGGTPQSKAAILVLPIFDRIGMTPRKHLKSIDRYHGGVRFEFLPKYSLNLRAYYAKDCPLCRIDSDIDSTFRTHEHVRQQLEANLSLVRHLLSPTYLTAIATCAPTTEMALLSKDDTATVAYASDALFSDLTSGSDIKKSIRDRSKSSIARLEILLNVMMDPILYRSVHEEEFFIGIITDELWRDGVLSNYRCYFLMHLPYLHSGDLARRILLEVIPQSLRAKPEPVELESSDGLKSQTPTQYFDAHPEVFACILMGTWVLRHQEEGLPERWDAEWRQTLRETPYGHQFVCGTSPTKEEVARAFAEMLLCNFVTHYKDHREAFQRRLENLRNLIDAGLRTNPIPKHSLVYLMNAIDTVRDHYDMGDNLLSRDITNEVLSLYDAWLAKNDSAGSRLRSMLVDHFAPEQTIHDATITQQLQDGLAPMIDDVIREARDDFEAWLREQARKVIPAGESADQPDEANHIVSSLLNEMIFNNEAIGLRVFGNTRFIVLTVAHLLRNAFESGMGRDTPLSSARPEIVLTAKHYTSNARPTIRIAVANAQVLTQDGINGCFRAGGGLMAQKQVNERWGGGMGGYPIDHGRTVFFLDLGAVEMARKGKI